MKKSKKFLYVVFFLVLFLGLSLMLYPILSSFLNSINQSYVEVDYMDKMAEVEEEDYSLYFAEAEDFNRRLLDREDMYDLPEEMADEYNRMLRLESTDVMGIIEIPKIKVSLPIYHGTSEFILEKGVGHIEWSSLPIGGKGTHSVLAAHRGLPTSTLFSDLNKMEKGDVFTITVLNRLMTYQVDQILVVEPEEVESMIILDGEDYCTLETCTPYGVNTHRLLVRGKRIPNIAEEESGVDLSDKERGIEKKLIVKLVIFIIVLLIIVVLLVLLLIRAYRRRKNLEVDS